MSTTHFSRFAAAWENTSRSTSVPRAYTCAPFDATKSMPSATGAEHGAQRVVAPTRCRCEPDARMREFEDEIVCSFGKISVLVEQSSVHVAGDKLDHRSSVVRAFSLSGHCRRFESLIEVH